MDQENYDKLFNGFNNRIFTSNMELPKELNNLMSLIEFESIVIFLINEKGMESGTAFDYVSQFPHAALARYKQWLSDEKQKVGKLKTKPPTL